MKPRKTAAQSAQAKLPSGFTLGSMVDGLRGRTWYVENDQTQSYLASYQSSPKAAVEQALKRLSGES